MKQTEKGKALAEAMCETMFQAHRGAFASGVELVVFGNDGYADSEGRARREVEAAVAWASGVGLQLKDFGTDGDGYSWALVFSNANPDELADLAVAAEDVLWRAWTGENPDAFARCYETVQRVQAMLAGGDYGPIKGEEPPPS